MLSLPPELLASICEYATRQECMQLRLVCSVLSAATTPTVFKDVKASIFSRHLNPLKEIACSKLAKHVRKIEFLPYLLPEWDREEWEEHVVWIEEERQVCMGYSPPPSETSNEDESNAKWLENFTEEEKANGWLAYTKQIGEQKRWRWNPESIGLRECLCALPNLVEATVWPLYSTSDTACAIPFLCECLVHDIYVHSYQGLPMEPDPYLVRVRNEPSEAASALMFAGALGQRNKMPEVKRVTKLTLEVPTLDMFWDLLAPFGEHVEPTDDFLELKFPARLDQNRERRVDGSPYLVTEYRHRVFLEATRCLTSLTLSCPDVQGHTKRNDDFKAKEVQQVLRNAGNLRVLDLRYGTTAYELDHWSSDLNYSLSPFLASPAVTFPHLRKLSISGCLPGHEFANFIALHCKTLEELRMHMVLSDDWEVILRAIARYTALDRLQTFCVHEVPRRESSGQSVSDRRSLFSRGLEHASDLTIAMKAFFAGNGSGKLPPEYYDDNLHGM